MNHVEVQELLPWFANGSLNEDEQSIVDQHLRECRECKDSVNRLVAISARFHAKQRSDDEMIRQAAEEFMQMLPPRAAPRGAAERLRPLIAVCAAMLLAAVIFAAVPRDREFRTLGRGAVVNGGPVIQIVFRPEATEKSIRNILLDGGNHVLSGPSAQGVYRIALGPDRDKRTYIDRLHRDPDVAFVVEEQ